MVGILAAMPIARHERRAAANKKLCDFIVETLIVAALTSTVLE